MSTNSNEALKKIPKVDTLLSHRDIRKAITDYGRDLVINAVRDTLTALRTAVLKDRETEIDESKIILSALNTLRQKSVPNLRRVINATGVILHTNLGRACLAEEAVRAVAETAGGYSTLEYTLANGKRGSRHAHTASLLCELSGGEDAMVVNNNAAAVMLMLSALVREKEVVVSRGEMVEIGGSFRIPDIMAASGAVLREVGTTNRTHSPDYEKAIGENTGALMKVNTSNYRIVGFTTDVSLEELTSLGRQYGLPVFFDLGGGLIRPIEGLCIPNEPYVCDSVRTGVDVICFSGDKLLGGPQAGIIIGKKKYIEQMKAHPLARALRVDKLTLAALETTLRLYNDAETVKQKIPSLRMLCECAESLLAKALRLAEKLAFLQDAVQVITIQGQVGGGTAPGQDLPGSAVALSFADRDAQQLEQALRQWKIPIIARIVHDRLLLDIRTIEEKDFPHIADCLNAVTKEGMGK